MTIKYSICFLLFLLCTFTSNAQLLLRTNSTFDFSAISTNSNSNNLNYAEKWNLEESFYYRKRYNYESKEKTVYSIFSIYKKNSVIGFCPYGIDLDIMSERFNKNKTNTFRYWNKIRMGLKFVIEKNINDTGKFSLDALIPELYLSYLHIPQSARGDQTTKARKGSFMIFFMITPLKRSLSYIKFNIGSIWIKPYFKQEQINIREMENFSGIYAEVEINRNGYNHSIVESSKDVYRGITLFGGPEYSFTNKKFFMNLGVLITTENH